MIALVILIAGLCVYAKFNHPWISLNECLSNPERFDGATVYQFREPRVGKIERDGFWLLQRQGPTVFVKSDTAGLKENSYLGMVAVFHKTGTLDAVRIQLAPKRREKMAVSLLPAVVICFLLIRAFRFDRNRMEFRPRKHA
jgi:hypothetical protein